jgi:hypothetical protein
VLAVEQLGTLQLDAPSQPGRPAHVAAASGLVVSGDRMYVVADDELALAVFEGGLTARLDPLSDEELPLDHDERKAAKPDLEALAELPDGSLLALGSGATPRRDRGWVWTDGASRELALGPLYSVLRGSFAELNIEGAAVLGERLWLAQRGNGAAGENALLQTDVELKALRDVVPYELGHVDGVPLTFSDLAPLPDGRLLFCAVAEDSASTYDDGPCVGAGIGVLDPRDRRVQAFDLLPEPLKVEGVALAPDGDGVLAVADADDVTRPAPLVRLPRPR